MAKIKNKAKKNLSDRVKEKKKKSTNPFEVHINRQKFSVVGRKLKHDKGLPGVARAKAFKKRKATLLQQYQTKNKSNRFMDTRIGEKNKYMSQEEKNTLRYVAARMKDYENTVYNLNDDVVLTHRGHILSEIEKFEDPKSDDEEDEKGKLDSKFVTEAHFGGFLTKKVETESSAKSREELIDQLIAESKKRRYEKQKMLDETLELTDKLDTQWKDLLPIMTFGNSEPTAKEKTDEPKNESAPKERIKVDPYDLAVQELKFEARGKPSEKLKTEEEIAMEEKEKLEKLESERQRRMHGFLDGQPGCLKHRSADDLDDGLVLESDIEEEDTQEKHEKTEKMDDESNTKGSDQKGDDDESEDENEDGKDEESEEEEANSDEAESDDEDDLSDLVMENFDDEKEKEDKDKIGEDISDCTKFKEDEAIPMDTVSPVSKPKKKKSLTGKEEFSSSEEKKLLQHKDEDVKDDNKNSKTSEEIRSELLQRKKMMEMARKELPYTYEVPDTADAFSEIMNGLGPEHQSVVLERMIKCTHPSLKSGNKQRLEDLFAILLQHLNDSAWASESLRTFSGQSPMSLPRYCFAVLASIIPYMYDLAQSSPERAAYYVSEVIKEKFSKLGKEYPRLDTLVYLRLIPQLFPTSDFRHPVSTPALILMTHVLRTYRVKSRQDVATGLFITTILLECTSLSKRFSPEVVNFLLGILYLAIPKAEGLPIPPPPPPPFRSNSSESNLLVIIKDPFRSCETEPELILESDDLDENQKKINGSFKARALAVASKLALLCIKQLKDIPSSKEIFRPFTNLIPLLPVSIYPKSLVDSIKSLENSLDEVMKDSTPLEKLTHAAKKPKPLKLYEPAIVDVFDGRKRRVMSREKLEHEKLLHKYKKEMKGAIREIRKDKDFIAKVKVKETLKNDMQRIEKVKEIFGGAALQQGEIRKLKRQK